MSDWYPGDTMVDVVGSDYYQSYGDYDTLSSIGTNKIVAIPETFRQLNPDSEPPFAYAIVWASRDWGGQGAEDAWRRAMANPKTLALENLPDMTRW